MGCTLSKLNNNDTVRCCKERRRLMIQAVHARHRLATAHSDYCCSLRHVGASLSAFAAAEPSFPLQSNSQIITRSQSLTHQQQISPSVSLRKHKPVKSPPILPHSGHRKMDLNQSSHDDPGRSSLRSSSRASSAWNWENLRPPSPPNSNLSRHGNGSFSNDHRIYRPDPQFFENPGRHVSVESNSFSYHRFPADSDPKIYEHAGHRNSQDSNSLFNHRHQSDPQFYSRWNSYDSNSFSDEYRHRPVPKTYKNSDLRSSPYSNRHFHNNRYQEDPRFDRNTDGSRDSNPIPRLQENGDTEEREDDVHCSEWSSTLTTSSCNDDVEEEDEIGSRSEFGSSTQSVSEYRPVGRTEKSGDWNSSSARWKPGLSGGGAGSCREISEMGIMVIRKSLKEIVDAIKDQFLSAANAGEKMSDILETGRAQLDRSFSQLRKTLHHSSNLLSNLSSSWMSKPPLEVKYGLDMGSLVESGGTKSLCTSLERLLAWEKKLYKDVKVREGAKIEHEKKLVTLQSQEYRKVEASKLDKTKASIKKLHSLIMVTSEAVSTTSNAINSLKEAHLVPQLIGLCHALKYMWKSMNGCHEAQACIVQQVQSLVTPFSTGESTSDTQRHVTHELQSAIATWHSAFSRLVTYQKDLVHSLHAWFKLALIPVNNEKNPTRDPKYSEVLAFLDEWKLGFDRIPDTVASEAIKGLVGIIGAIYIRQTEELKIKKRAENAWKEMERKASSIRDLEFKFYRSYSVVGPSGDPMADRKTELERWRRKAEGERARHLKAAEATKVMTLNNIQSGLPGVFRAMAGFSAVFVEAMEAVCTASYAIK